MSTTTDRRYAEVIEWANACTQQELVAMCWIAESKRDERGDERTDKLLRGYAEIGRKRGFKTLTPQPEKETA